MPAIHITDIEAAINYWRAREPSPDGVRLPGPTRALAEFAQGLACLPPQTLQQARRAFVAAVRAKEAP